LQVKKKFILEILVNTNFKFFPYTFIEITPSKMDDLVLIIRIILFLKTRYQKSNNNTEVFYYWNNC